MAGDDVKGDMPNSPDIHFEPIVKLAPVEVKTLEENEEVIVKLRARLYRYENDEDPPEWKERGTGEVKLLKHRENSRIRVLMRRDKTLKICANHYITPDMVLKPNCGSNKAWVWYTPADFADEEAKAETLAIRFGNADHAKEFKEAFEKCQKDVESLQEEKKDDEKEDVTASGDDKQADEKSDEKDAAAVTEKLEELSVKDKAKENGTTEEGDKDATKEGAKEGN